ncbi:MAG: hypothetical protein NW201_12215 [Gemmatimonadales bacterium]|nr:hypothetical protein [Gemmatimonadales bacterium]
MPTPLTETLIQSGRASARSFAADCTAGDWHSWQVAFATPFPDDDVIVVAMASDHDVDEGAHVAAVVPVVRGTSRSGFTLAGRNSDSAAGSAGMHWLAVRRRPGVASGTPVDLRTAVVPPRAFAPDGTVGDWQQWDWRFARPLRGEPAVVGSAARTPGGIQRYEELFGVIVPSVGQWHFGAAVGVSLGASASALRLAARNPTGWPGQARVPFVAVAPGGVTDPALHCETGRTAPVAMPGAHLMTSEALDVQFDEPFLVPPIVLVTACEVGLAVGESAVALVGVVEDATTHGFTLRVMSSDCAPGRAAFNWVAIGCQPGCGGGRVPPAEPPRTPPTDTPGTPPITITVPPAGRTTGTRARKAPAKKKKAE